jgi:polysaccharide biosynthesis/export protein
MPELPSMFKSQDVLSRVLASGLIGLTLMSSPMAFASDPDQSEPPPAQDRPQDFSKQPIAGIAREVSSPGAPYRIGVEDVLLVSVWRDADLTREVPVRPDGKISLPLIQDVTAAGKTPEELGREIQTRLKEFMSNPSVTVIVREINSIKIYVLGEVAKPGPVTPKSEISLLQAIAMAGGITPFGGKKPIRIFRKSASGESVIEVSYQNIITGKKPQDDLILESGDTVVVR